MSSNFVKISDGGGKVESGQGGVSIEGEKGRYVPLHSNIREGHMSKATVTEGGDASFESGKRSVRVSSSDLQADINGLDFQDRHGRSIGDPRKVTDDCTVAYAGTRVSIQVALSTGLIKVDGQGNYSVVEQKAPEQTKPEQLEPIVYEEDRNTLSELNSRVSSSLTDSFMATLFGNIVSGKQCDSLIADYSSAVGATAESIKNWAESYSNHLLDSGLDMTVRASGGKFSGEEIMQYIDGCSDGYKRSLLLSLHFGNRKAISELLSNLNQRKNV